MYASFPPFLQYSIRGYADTTFTTLLLAAILIVLRADWRWAPWGLGFALGALSLTRYEGVVASVPLFLLAAWQWRRQWRRWLLTILVVLLTLLPYVVVCWRVGRSLLPEAYLAQGASEEQGYGAASVGELIENYNNIWERLGLYEAWVGPAILWGELRDDPLGWHRHVVNRVAAPRAAVSLAALVGVVFLVGWRRKQALMVLVPFLTVAVPIAWWAPLVRYDAFLYPLMVLLAVGGWHAGLGILARATYGSWGRAVRGVAAGGLVFVAVAVWSLGLTQESQQGLRKSRGRDLAFYQALQHAQRVSGVVALEKRQAITELYFPERAIYLADLPEDLPVWPELERQRVTYLLREGAGMERVIAAAPSAVMITEVASYTVDREAGGPETASLYSVHYHRD